MNRKAANRALDQETVDDEFVANDILANDRQYPTKEAPAACGDFDAVLDSVKAADLASEAARIRSRFVTEGTSDDSQGRRVALLISGLSCHGTVAIVWAFHERRQIL